MSDVARRFRAKFDEYRQKQNLIPAVMGDGHGNVQTDNPNEIIIRIGDEITTCMNYTALCSDNLDIWIGIEEFLPGIVQVLGVRWRSVGEYESLLGNIPNHGWRHEFFGGDPIDIDISQVVSLRVLPDPEYGDKYIKMEGGTILLDGVPTYIPLERFDMQSYYPLDITKLRLVLMTIDTTGDVIFTVSGDLDPPVEFSDSPAVPEETAFVLALIRLDPALDQIIVAREGRDIIDLRWMQSGVGGSSEPIVGGNKFLLYHSGNEVVSYNTLDDASTAAVSGDFITIPVGTFSGDHTLANGVEYAGIAREKVVLTGQITLGSGTTLRNLSIIRSANDANALIGVIGGSGVYEGQVTECVIRVHQDGAGDSRGIRAIDESVSVDNCTIETTHGYDLYREVGSGNIWAKNCYLLGLYPCNE